MKKIVLFCLSSLLFQCFTANAQKKNQVTIAFYNTENLFDTKDDPAIDDEEYLPTSKSQWTEERYKKKLENLSKVIDSLGGGPSVLGVCEVENKEVLEDLAQTDRLAKKKYGIVHEHSPDKRGIDVALMYKKADFEPEFHKMIRVYKDDEPDFITRDIMLVKGHLRKQPVYFFINHWPSRRGGEEKSAGKRFAAAKAARMAIDTIMAAHPNAKIMLMGDFNDEPTDSSITQGLKASIDEAKVENGLYNAMAPMKLAGEGSHYFNNGRHMLDQIIISTDLLNEKAKPHFVKTSATIYRPVWMQDKNPKYLGSPYRTYAGAKYLGGYSDHFPVYCTLEF